MIGGLHWRKPFKTEMEAAAHYTTLAHSLPMQEIVWNRLLDINEPRKGRPDPETGYSKELGSWVIDVDKEHMTLVDQLDEEGKISPKGAYYRFKDDFWFMRGGHVTGITSVRWDAKEGKAYFQYTTLFIGTHQCTGPPPTSTVPRQPGCATLSHAG